MVQQQYLHLTADEVMILTDRIQNHDRGTEDMACSAYPLLLRLGSAYLEMLGDRKQEGEIPIAVSEAEAWLLRSKVTSGERMPSDQLFGVKLLQKIYCVLLAYNADVPLPDTEEPSDDAMTSTHRARLEQWKADNPDDSGVHI